MNYIYIKNEKDENDDWHISIKFFDDNYYDDMLHIAKKDKIHGCITQIFELGNEIKVPIENMKTKQ